MTPFHRAGAVETAAAVPERRLTVLEIAGAVLERIKALDGTLQAWVYLDPDLLDEARRLDTEAADGALRGPLHGVPVGIKDIYDVARMPTRAGSRALADAGPAERDAEPVARLRRAGALIVGKTATTEFAGPEPAATVNPWDTGHTPGGSSSGSAAAVAAGMVPAALGSQTAGSVLRPASFCGIVGFKPSFGAVGREGVLPFAWSLDTMGTLTRSVADAALVFEVLRESPRASGGALAPQGAPTSAPRLGYLPRLFPERQHPAMGKMLSAVAAALERAGAGVREAALPGDFATSLAAHELIMMSEAAAFHRRHFADRLQLYGQQTRRVIDTGSIVPAAAYVDAQRVRHDLYERTVTLFARYDALLAPAAAGPAPEGLGFTGDTSFNAPWTLLGLPAITLCGGLDADGLPLGLQLVGAPGADDALLEVAAWCERALPPPGAPPQPYS